MFVAIACFRGTGPCAAASIEIILALKLLKFIGDSSYGILIECYTIQRTSGFPFKIFFGRSVFIYRQTFIDPALVINVPGNS